MSFGGTKSSFSNSFSSYNPSIASESMSFAVSQNLIRNRGRYVNRIPVMQAESSLPETVGIQPAIVALLNWVNTAESAYWSSGFVAREKCESPGKGPRDLQSQSGFRSKAVGPGRGFPARHLQPTKGQLASADLSLSQARFSLQQAEDAFAASDRGGSG